MAITTAIHRANKKICVMIEASTYLGHNAAPLLTVEALMCVLAR
jgi:hypothetical protein